MRKSVAFGIIGSTFLVTLAVFVVDIQLRAGAVVDLLENEASCDAPHALETCSAGVDVTVLEGRHRIIEKLADGMIVSNKKAFVRKEKASAVQCTSLVDCSSDDPAHVGVAESLVAALQKTKENKYFDGCGGLQHVAWPAADGSSCAAAFVDSSLFVTVLLYHANNWRADDFINDFGNANPIASQYYDAADDERVGWKKVPVFSALAKGDFIFVKYPDNADGASGHCMLVDSAPRPVKNGGYEIDVIDAAKTAHGKSDTRTKNPGKYGANGVGKGTIRVVVKNEKITGYSWSAEENSPVFSVENRPLVMARVDPVVGSDLLF